MFSGTRKKYLLIVFFLLVFGVVAQAGYARVQAQSSFLEFIYIDATAGEAAAGHSAVKLGQTVFHFQFHSGGLLLLAKQNWEDFRYYYNDLSNRTLEIAAIPLAESIYQTIRQSFQEQYIRQQMDLSRRSRLQEEHDLYVNLARGESAIEIEGLGLFLTAVQTGGQAAEELLHEVETRFGREFLLQDLAKTEQQIVRAAENLLLPLSAKAMQPVKQEYGEKTSRLKGLLAQRESLLILLEKKGLKAENLVYPARAEARIDRRQRRQMAGFQQQILQSILLLLESDRSDKGLALLIQIARYQVIGRSLAEDRFLTLYPYARYWKKKEQEEDLNDPRGHFHFLIQEAFFFSERTEDSFFSAGPDRRNIAYSMLEKAKAKLLFYEQAAEGRITADNLFAECGLPCLAGQVSLEVSPEKERYREVAGQVWQKLQIFNQQLEKRYGYNLFSKNCSTELVRIINNSFTGKRDMVSSLGGTFHAGQGLSYVPFGLHDKVLSSFSVQRQEVLPAYRLRELEKLYREEGGNVWFREANTITSTVYTPWDSDGHFLFFTDDLLISRPIFGLVNLCYGVLQTLGGVVTAPVDEGRRFVRGLDGMFFSLPEIFFFNIRKGSFQIIDR